MSNEQLIATPSVFGDGGNFILERELGQGGMGAVYMGRDKMLDRPVAVKVMLREYGSDEEFVGKFKKEAQAVARLIHPNIAQVYSYGIFDGMPYIAMELVAGGSLDQLMKTCGTNMDIPRTMKICEQVAQALRCAADQGLVHGDVKPENVLLDSNGNAKLVDFGLAAMQKDTDEIWGTPYYIAPEKVKKQPVDYRADMYSLGGTIYHALCGVAPFEGEDAVAVVKARFQGMPKKPSEVRPGISPQIDFLVMKLLAMNPADRYPTFEALLEDFKKVMAMGLNSTGSLSVTSTTAIPTGSVTATASTGKKVMLKPRKKFKTPSTTAQVDDESAPATTSRLSLQPEEEEGGVGGKVVLTIGAVIAAIGLVVGGLIWYQVADKKARAAELQRQIDVSSAKARESLSKTREAAVKFADEFDAFVTEAVANCEGHTKKLKRVLSDAYAESVVNMVKPPPTKELLDAIASTNAAPAEAAAPAPAAEKKPAQEAAAQPAPAKGAEPARFRAPVDDEADPNSPAHQEYLKEKAEWEAAQRAKAAQPAAAEPAAEAAEAAAASNVDADGKSLEVPIEVNNMIELWQKAYSCQAATIRIRTMINELLTEIDSAATLTGHDEPTMRKLVDLANAAKERYETIKSSKEVIQAQKDKGFINSRGKKSIEDMVRKLREESARKAREEAKKKALEEEQRRKEEQAEAKAKLIEEETEAAKALYEEVVAGGKIRQLDWKGAYRMFDAFKPKSAEGQLALAEERKKVEYMELMQKILIEGMKGYKFTRGAKDAKVNLKNAVVKSADTREITVIKQGKRSGETIPWQSFYARYHNNLDELISRFIIKSGSVPGSKRLSKMDKYSAMVGTAFIMQIVCSDNPSAMAYGDKLLKDAVRDFPLKYKEVKAFFPNVDFSDIEGEIDEEYL